MYRHASRAALLCLLLVVAAFRASAHDYWAKKIHVTHPFATPSAAASNTGAAYIALENEGKEADRLIGASTPVATRMELHTTTMAGGTLRMHEVSDIEIAPGRQLKMRPGGDYHLMLVELRQPLKEGATFPIRLQFERGGEVEVKAYVQTPKTRRDSAPIHIKGSIERCR